MRLIQVLQVFGDNYAPIGASSESADRRHSCIACEHVPAQNVLRLCTSSNQGPIGTPCRVPLPGRLELPTLRLTASRSNQLSYGSTCRQCSPAVIASPRLRHTAQSHPPPRTPRGRVPRRVFCHTGGRPAAGVCVRVWGVGCVRRDALVITAGEHCLQVLP